MKMLNTLTSNAYHDLIDYNVVDQSGDHVGTLHSLWSDQNTGALEFLGVKTGWLFGKNHVVPAEKAQIDEDNRFVQIPFAAAFIKEAPSIAADAEITEDQEAEIYRYYGMSGAVGVTGATTGTAATTDYSATRTTSESETTINDLGRTGAAFAGTGTTGAATTGHAATTREAGAGENIEVPISEEQLRVGKREVESGSVRLRKVIRTETVNQPVELRREEVVVERIPAGEVTSTDAKAFEGAEIVVPVRHEEAVVGKETVVTGAVRVHKTSETETQNVSDTVRKEDVEVDRGSVGATHGTTGTSAANYAPGGTTTGAASTVSTGYTATGGTSTTGHSGDLNPDPITGEPGAHPVGTAIGGVSGALTGAAVGGAGAAATGAAFGAAAGPIGAAIGGIAGAVVGGLVGKGVEEHFDPTEEGAYWKDNYRSSSSYDPSMSYEDYEPAYRSGYTGFGKYYGNGKRFEDVESNIRSDYESAKGNSRLAYDKARNSIKEAYDRLSNRVAGERRS